MTILYLFSALLFSVGAILILGLTPESITNDIMELLSPKVTLYEAVRKVKTEKKKPSIGKRLEHIREALIKSGKGNQFAVVCASSLGLAVAGCVAGILAGNIFIVPVLSIAMGFLPFLYAKLTVSSYDKRLKAEMESAMSVITSSYIRTDDIITAVSENLGQIRPPVKSLFQAFVADSTLVSASIKDALRSLRGKINNEIFFEWCTTLIQCQDDRTLKDSLLSIVSKFTDVRIVNNELTTVLAEIKKEYRMMAALVFANIPILYFINRDWFHTLMYSIPGKITLAVCGTTVLVTAILMNRFTKPVEYRK